MKTTVTASHMTQPQTRQVPSAKHQQPPRSRLCRWALLAVALTLFPAVWAQANSQAFSRIFVFGDSLSDTGNFFKLNGGFPPPPYFEGRFSNGRLWVEQLADALGMSIAPGDNYAVVGATTGHFNVNNGFNGRGYPGLLDEIASFKATRNAAEAEGALFIVWAGANDFFLALSTGQIPEVLIGNGVGNTVQAIQQLWQAGARHIMVVNVPDLGLTPFALAMGIGSPLTQLSAAYNQALNSALDSLASVGVPTIRVDAFALLREMVTQPAQFGFTNVTDQLILVGGNADEFLFWDTVHPTTKAHAVVAEAAADSLISYFSPRQDKGTPAARINSLNGLVNAWSKN